MGCLWWARDLARYPMEYLTCPLSHRLDPGGEPSAQTTTSSAGLGQLRENAPVFVPQAQLVFNALQTEGVL